MRSLDKFCWLRFAFSRLRSLRCVLPCRYILSLRGYIHRWSKIFQTTCCLSLFCESLCANLSMSISMCLFLPTRKLGHSQAFEQARYSISGSCQRLIRCSYSTPAISLLSCPSSSHFNTRPPPVPYCRHFLLSLYTLHPPSALLTLPTLPTLSFPDTAH
jgi:hypothetical protein